MATHVNVELQLQLSEEVHRASRLRTPLSIVLFTVDPCTVERETALLRCLCELCRTTDRTYEDGSGRAVVVLPGTATRGALRFVDRVRYALPEVPLRAGIADLELTSSFSPVALLSEAERRLEHARMEGVTVAAAAPMAVEAQPTIGADQLLEKLDHLGQGGHSSICKTFTCPDFGWRVVATFDRVDGRWSVQSCSAFGDHAPQCQKRCITYLESRVPLESSWTAERTESGET